MSKIGEIIKCNHCGKNLIAKHNTNYFHPSCYKKHKLLRERKYRRKHKEEIKNYMVKWREKTLGRPKLKERTNLMKQKYLKKNFTLGYLVGVIWGDGFITFNGKNKEFGRIGLSVTDKDFSDEFNKRLKEIFPYHIYNHESKIDNRKKKYNTSISSFSYSKYLNKFDIKDIENSNKFFKAGFLKGIFDSEGSVGFYNKDNLQICTRMISFSQKDFEIISLVKKLLYSFGINSYCHKKIGSGFKPEGIYYYLTLFGKENLKKFRNSIGFSIKRKNDILQEILNSYMKLKKCEYCNNLFQPRESHQFCCENCSEVHLKEYHLNYEEMRRFNRRIENAC